MKMMKLSGEQLVTGIHYYNNIIMCLKVEKRYCPHYYYKGQLYIRHMICPTCTIIYTMAYHRKCEDFHVEIIMLYPADTNKYLTHTPHIII